MTYEAFTYRLGAYRVVLEERAEGVYVNVFESASAVEAYIDMLQPDLRLAKLSCAEDYGIGEDQWKQAPEVNWHAPA